MKTRDWTIEKYRELCALIKDSGRAVLPVVDYLSNPSEGRKMVIRHDVDISAKKALSMAGVEHCFGFRTSYYFRKRTFSPKIMYQVSQLGHEVGYHYEVLDRTRGDYSLGSVFLKKTWNSLGQWRISKRYACTVILLPPRITEIFGNVINFPILVWWESVIFLLIQVRLFISQIRTAPGSVHRMNLKML